MELPVDNQIERKVKILNRNRLQNSPISLSSTPLATLIDVINSSQTPISNKDCSANCHTGNIILLDL